MIQIRRPLSRRRRLGIAATTALLVLAADQASKAVAATLPYDRFIPVIDHVAGFGLIRNSGAAFSTLSGRNGLLTVAAILVLLVIAWLLYQGTVSSALTAISLGAMLGGGLGNLVDRIRLGAVVDFIDLRFWISDFNLADVAIRLGAIVLVLSVIFGGRRRPAGNSEAA